MKVDGLSMEQERAANLIAMGKGLTDAAISKKVGVSTATLKKWKVNIRFKLRTLQLFESNIEIERAYRVKRISKYLTPIYKEIAKKIDDKDLLGGYSLKDLLRMMVSLHAEVRSDGQFDKRFLKIAEDDDHADEAMEREEDMLSSASSNYAESRKSSKKIVSIR